MKALFWIGVLLAPLAFLTPISSPDLFMHLSIGRLMAQSHALPRVDVWSHTFQGAPWMDYEWLDQLIYYGIFKTSGWMGLLIFRAAILSALLVVVLRLLALAGAGRAAQGLGALFLSCLILPVADVRPDNFSLLFFAVLLLVLERRRRARAAWRARHCAAIAALFCLWANLHPFFLYGLALIAFYGTVEQVAPALLAAFAGTLINPFGPRLYATFFEHAKALPLMENTICEWLPMDMGAVWAPFWALVLLSYAVLLIHFLRTRRTPYVSMLLMLASSLAAAQHRRMIGFFALIALPFLAAMITDLPRLSRWSKPAGAALFASLVLYQFRFVWPQLPPRASYARAFVPAGACDFLERESSALTDLRIYNSLGDGGYLSFRLYPRFLVYLDGRALFEPLITETMAGAHSPGAWQDLLRRRKIGLAILKRPAPLPDALSRTKTIFRPHYLAYMPEKDWALVYWDERDMVLVRRDEAGAAWLSGHEYRFLRPNDLRMTALRVRDGSVSLKALDAELARHERETRADSALERWRGELAAK